MNNEIWEKDYIRFAGQNDSLIKRYLRIKKNHGLMHIYFYRKCMEQSYINKTIFEFLKKKSEKKYGLEINSKSIGGGILLVHPYNITINGRAIIGDDLTIFKGATIGSVRSGKREGSPIIGNRVTIMPGAMVCGGVTIGDDVLIAANSFVDFDVPSNSIVVGNPGVIKMKNNPSADYINR